MARRRRTKRRGVRRAYTRAKRRVSRSGKGDLAKVLGAGIYGALRAKASTKLAPITSKVPFGQVSDEAVMLGVSYLLAKGKIPVLNKVGILRDVGKAGMLIESARIGEFIGRQGFAGLMPSGATARTSTEGAEVF